MSEISGIIKNGLQRGWPIQEIYQSLVNTGYDPNEIQIEIAKFSPQNNQNNNQPNINAQKLSQYQISPGHEKKSASKLAIISIILLIFIILSTAGYIFFK